MRAGTLRITRERVGWSRPHMQGAGLKTWWSNWSVGWREGAGGGETRGYARTTLGRAKAVVRELRQRKRLQRFPVLELER